MREEKRDSVVVVQEFRTPKEEDKQLERRLRKLPASANANPRSHGQQRSQQYAHFLKLRPRLGSTQSRRLSPLRIHPRTSRQASPVTIFLFWICLVCKKIGGFFELLFYYYFNDWWFLCRRDLLDISPTLTEAAGAIVDVIFCDFALFGC